MVEQTKTVKRKYEGKKTNIYVHEKKTKKRRKIKEVVDFCHMAPVERGSSIKTAFIPNRKKRSGRRILRIPGVSGDQPSKVLNILEYSVHLLPYVPSTLGYLRYTLGPGPLDTGVIPGGRKY